MLAVSIAILFTLLHAAASLRAGRRAVSIGAPAVLLGVSTGCAVWATFASGGASGQARGLIGPAELIVAPVVLSMLACCAMVIAARTQSGIRVLAGAGLLFLLGAFALIDRVDALSGQLLFVFGLALLWLHGSPTEDSERAPGGSVMPFGLAGFIASVAVGYAIWTGPHPLLALALVSANLLIWTIARREFAPVAIALVIGVCIAAGVANLARIFGGAMQQPEWASGDKPNAVALELNSGPYVPGFSATAPDVLLLVLGVLLTVLASEAPDDRRSSKLRLALLAVCGVQAGWMAIAAW